MKWYWWLLIAAAVIVVIVLVMRMRKPQPGGTGNGSMGKMSEAEAKNLAKEVSNLLETESAEGIAQAQILTVKLMNGGWNYVDYNVVSPIL